MKYDEKMNLEPMIHSETPWNYQNKFSVTLRGYKNATFDKNGLKNKQN